MLLLTVAVFRCMLRYRRLRKECVRLLHLMLQKQGIQQVLLILPVLTICLQVFIREGTPSGFNTISSGRPFGRNGMSSTGNTRETTPLLP